ncbi:phage baseplate protein [Rahnella inusitata]|uniref:phage baseplate protein n=1 Tax=Rahnella inusitata TaxID=58169 RepID=UPI0039BE4046
MDVLSVLFNQRSRKIGLIIPDVVVSEKHQDALEITEHPVEIGAPVSDHAYKRPSEVTMEIGFSGGGSLLDFADTSALGISLGTSPKEIYQQILDLQASRVPFDVTTGKRQYSNMLIRAIDVTTDRTSENVLMCVLTLREVIISQTGSITVADKADMQEGVSTASLQNTGTKSAKTANSSLLLTLFSGAKGAFGL